MNRDISKRIPFIGFMMICIIVMYHCGSSPAVPFNKSDQLCFDVITNLFNSLATLSMGYFFVVTGFLLFCGLTLSNWFQKVRRRFFSLLIPYLLWQFLTFSVNLLHHEAMPKYEFLKTTFLFEQWPPDGALWYLYAVFVLALLSPVTLFFYERLPKRHGFWLTMAAVLFVYYLREAEFASNFCNYGYISNILLYAPSYLLGSYFGFYHSKSSERESLSYLLAVLLTSLNADILFPGFFSAMALQTLPIAMLYLLPIPEILCNRKIYHISFLIYALHQPLVIHFLNPVRDSIYAIYPAASASLINGLGRILYLLFVILLASVLHCILAHFCPKGLDILTGGRK